MPGPRADGECDDEREWGELAGDESGELELRTLTRPSSVVGKRGSGALME